MLSDRIWRDRFDARRDVVGQSIMVNGVRHTVIGVMPPGFEFPAAAGRVDDDAARSAATIAAIIRGR